MAPAGHAGQVAFGGYFKNNIRMTTASRTEKKR